MITVFTIVYNNYGRFIPQWVEWMKKQTIKPKLLIVLGKEHGADIKYLKDNNIKYVLCDSDNMGKLRNAGLEQVKTKWWLYFSVDDELLPHACEEIVNTDADAVSLTFDVIKPDGKVLKEYHSPCINTIEELNNWQRCWGGYVAIKGNTDIRFNENIEVPNLTLHFELFKRGLKTVRSNGTSAIHHRWNESHHFRSKNIRKSFIDEIESTKNEIIEEMIGGKNMRIRALRNYIDNELAKKDNKTKVLRNGEYVLTGGNIQKGDEYEVSNERGKQILSHPKNLAMLVEIVKKEAEVLEDKKEEIKLEEDKNASSVEIKKVDINSIKEYKPKKTSKKKTTTKNTTKKKSAKK